MAVVAQSDPPGAAADSASAAATATATASSSPPAPSSPIARSLTSPTKSNKSGGGSPTKALGNTGTRFAQSVAGGFPGSPQQQPQQDGPGASMYSTTSLGRDATSNDLALQRRGSHFDLEFQKRDSVNNIRREVETIQQSTAFFHRDFDKDIHVFTEPPDVKVLGGRSEEAWPTRYVEYDVEV